MEQSPRTFLPLAAVEDRRREIRLEFHNQIQRLRALEKVIQNLLIAGEIFENLEHDVGWYFKPEPELFRDIVEVRGKVASIVTQLNPETDSEHQHQHQSQSHQSQRPRREFHQPRRRDRDGSEKNVRHNKFNNGNFQGGGFFYGILLTVIDLKLIYNND